MDFLIHCLWDDLSFYLSFGFIGAPKSNFWLPNSVKMFAPSKTQNCLNSMPSNANLRGKKKKVPKKKIMLNMEPSSIYFILFFFLQDLCLSNPECLSCSYIPLGNVFVFLKIYICYWWEGYSHTSYYFIIIFFSWQNKPNKIFIPLIVNRHSIHLPNGSIIVTLLLKHVF